MLVRFLANAAAIAVATFLVPGITLKDGPIESKAVTLLLVGAIFGLVNSIVKPLFKFAAAPLILVTLGLFLLIVNAALLLLTSWVSEQLALGWHVTDFGSAAWGALIVSVVSFIVNQFFGKKGEEHR